MIVWVYCRSEIFGKFSLASIELMLVTNLLMESKLQKLNGPLFWGKHYALYFTVKCLNVLLSV